MFYTYSYVKDGVPYYIGKGQAGRAYAKHRHTNRPDDRKNVHIIAHYEDEVKALLREWELITFLGVKSEGGLLENRWKGHGYRKGVQKMTEEQKRKISVKAKARAPQLREQMLGNKINEGRTNRALTYELIYPDGTVKIVYNLKKYCRENGLSPTAACNVVKGLAKTHKGIRINKIKAAK